MMPLPQRALSLAGFVLAHAAWSLSESDADEPLCPLAVVEDEDGDRRMTRFEAETQQQAIVAGKSAMRDVKDHVAAWAFAREGSLRWLESKQSGDVLLVDFWARGMLNTATLMQFFYRATYVASLRIGSAPTLVVGDEVLSPDIAAASIAGIMDGVHAHTIVAGLWQSWRSSSAGSGIGLDRGREAAPRVR